MNLHLRDGVQAVIFAYESGLIRPGRKAQSRAEERPAVFSGTRRQKVVRAPETPGMAAPQGLTLRRHRDLEGGERRPYVRRVLIGLLVVFLALALLNLFGQRPDTATGATEGVELEVYSPTRIRSGRYFMSCFTIRAEQELANATRFEGALDNIAQLGDDSSRPSPR